MRRIVTQQPFLVPQISHPHARELEVVSEILDELPELNKGVHGDLLRGVRCGDTGREGMSAEQVLRVLVLKQMKGFSYEALAFELAGSWVYQRFCRIDPNGRMPSCKTLQRNLRKMRAQTLEAIYQVVVHYAVEQRVDKGDKVRTDCTVQQTDIHEPTDSSLLWDGVRVLTRLLGQAAKLVKVGFVDHTRRAKRRAKGILHAKTNEQRVPMYEDLLKVTRKTLSYVEPCIYALKHAEGTLTELAEASLIAQQLAHYSALSLRVIEQTQRRVLQGESVPVGDKIVSLFEPHTDIIKKERRETLYGHKVCLTTGTSGLVLDIRVLEGNPADCTLAIDAMQRLAPVLGKLPKQASFDGAFASKANLRDIKELGVKDVVFHKKSGLQVSEMATSSYVYRTLKRFRAGIESGISFLKRCFGLDRCTWKGFEGFKAYTFASTLAHNLLLIARHRLA